MVVNQDLLKDNSLFNLRPDLLSEWDFEKNSKFDIHLITKGSEKKYWWKCLKCNSSFENSPNKRFSNRNCPYCAGKRVNHTNSLAAIFPKIAEDWHPTKNGDLTPHDVTCGSEKRAWWTCDEGHEWETAIITRCSHETNCHFCSNHKVLKGFNDLWTTHPHIAELLINKEDGFKYSQGSGIKVSWKCSSCSKYIGKKSINNTVKRSAFCSACSKSKSFPERIVSKILHNTNIKFVNDRSFYWSKKKRYDFYLPFYNLIIETHGEQHYRNTFFKDSLEYQVLNDSIKRELALKNGIDNYVELDCRLSSFEYIKRQIDQSELPKILGKINYKIDFNFSDSEDISSVIRLHKEGKSNAEIQRVLGISKHAVKKYISNFLEISGGVSD